MSSGPGFASGMRMEFEQLGPYRLAKKLGHGGMGTVYEGVDVETDQAAAVKVLAPQLALEAGFRARFEAEIESLKKLRHPNIVRLFGYGEQSGTLFYAMELVDGPSVEEILASGRRFFWREVTQLAVQLCRALKHAHDHGVIHRDIKPANLLMPSAGGVKLSDFGIARLFGNTRMTSDGGILGTAEYMAPEQAEGRPLTERCDQYSLGGVMYAMLAGRAPFRANSFVEMLQMQRFSEPTPLARVAPDTPLELQRIVHQLLEKDPQKRFTNTLMLGRALEAMLRGLSLTGIDESPAATRPGTPSNSTIAATAISHVPGESDRSETDYELEPRAVSATAASPTLSARESAEPVSPLEPVRNFTKVSEQSDDHAPWYREAWRSIATPQTLALTIGLAVLVAGVWLAMRAPTADQLFAKVETLTADGSLDGLRNAESDIRTFLAQFPDDSRAAGVEGKLETLELARRDRKLKLQARGIGKGQSLSAVERSYTEATSLETSDPELAWKKLKAIVDVYDDPDASAESREFVNLARTELARLTTQLQQDAQEQRALVKARLARADELWPSDPAGARRIWDGIVELYSGKLWAEQLVGQARSALKERRVTAVDSPSSDSPTSPP